MIEHKLKSEKGTTLLEVLIASFLTALITAAAFNFYTRLDSQTETQFQLSDAYNNCRISLEEIKKTIRRSGFKVPENHPAYELSDDSLVVYYQDLNPIDTVHFYLEEFSESDYQAMSNLPSGLKVYKLLKRVNSDQAQVYSDYLTYLEYDLIDSSNISINLEVITGRRDFSRDEGELECEEIDENLPEGMYFYQGYLFFKLSERVQLRNLG